MNLVQFLREKNVYDLCLPSSITEKLVQASFVELTKIYGAIQGYKALGVWSTGSFSDDEIKTISQQVTNLLIEYGYVKPTKPTTSSPSQPGLLKSRADLPVKGLSGESRVAKAQAAPISREVHNPTRRDRLPIQEPNSTFPVISRHSPPASHVSGQFAALVKFEEQFAPLLYQVGLVGEVAISSETLETLSTELWRQFYNVCKQKMSDGQGESRAALT